LADWIAASNVPAKLDPLNPRLAREVWQFAGAMDSHRFIAGWAKFFAKNDFRTLDAHLVRQAGNESIQRSSYQAHCVALRNVPAATEFKLHCSTDRAVANSIDLEGRFDTVRNGHLGWITFGSAGQVRDLAFETEGAQRSGSDYVLRGVLKANGLAARLPDGRVLAGAEIRWPATASEERPSKSSDVHFQVVLLDDFALVRQGVRRLLAKQPSLFDDAPLVRPSLMSALFSELGMAERSWCCVDDADMPPPMLDPSEANASALEKREWQPFFQYCAMCHLTHEQFPPNFLSGDATHVADNLRQCAPRMLVRLLAWRTPVEQRVKSPMPPATAMHALGTTTRQWANSEELEVLRAYLEGLTRQAGLPSDPGELLKHGYEGLPKCLSDAN
jgi:hypothetical protein